MLSAVTTEAITRWENGLPMREGISRRTAGDARSLLGTILGDAAHKPPLIPYNPALRPPNRGRKTGRRLARTPQRAWATPLQALILAERAALLTGREDDFTLMLTLAYTGLRWGEIIGLEDSFLRPGEIRVEWQIREVGGKFYRLPPKDDSYRSPAREPCLPVDLPPFLAALLTRQAGSARHRCACAPEHGGSGQYVFPSPDGSHHRRSNYGRRVFRPACDGRHEPVSDRPPADRHRRRHHLARDPSCHLASRHTGQRGSERSGGLRSAARARDPDHSGWRSGGFLAAAGSRPDRPWAQARPSHLDGRRRHPGHPRRAAPRP
jgi:integrase